MFSDHLLRTDEVHRQLLLREVAIDRLLACGRPPTQPRPIAVRFRAAVGRLSGFWRRRPLAVPSSSR